MSLLDLAKAMVKDESGKLADPFDYNDSISAALKRYSRSRPQTKVEDLAGNASHDLDLPASWTADFSTIVTLEYPIGSIPATILTGDAWQFYRTPSGTKIRLIYDKPAVSSAVRCEYTLLHDETTLPVSDLEAVAALAASFCLRRLAAIYGQTSDSSIQADVVNYRSKSDEYRRLADSYEEVYNKALGLRKDDGVAPAMASTGPVATDRTRMTHGRGSWR